MQVGARAFGGGMFSSGSSSPSSAEVVDEEGLEEAARFEGRGLEAAAWSKLASTKINKE